jgi:hypothetical protein
VAPATCETRLRSVALRRYAIILGAIALAGCSPGALHTSFVPSSSIGNNALKPAQAVGDTYLPWEGGAAYYRSWPNGPDPTGDVHYFPLEVWLQYPPEAAQYESLGIDVYNGLWRGPTKAQLVALSAAGMPAFASQNEVGLTDSHRSILKAWDQVDEPDDAQSKPSGGYGPCISPAKIVRRYDTMRARDSTRPVFLNFSQAVANPKWPGRGSCTGDYADYPKYIGGADIISYDLYPVNNSLPLWWVAKGIDRLRAWAHYKKPVYEWFETTRINRTDPRPSPENLKSEVWLSLIHGALGVGYFTYVFTPKFNEAELLDKRAMAKMVDSIDRQIVALAPELNTPSVANGVTVESSNARLPVDTMLKRSGGKSYLFAAGARDAGSATATFTLRGLTKTVVADVLGEHRTIVIRRGRFRDAFTGYEIHLYRIPFVPR